MSQPPPYFEAVRASAERRWEQLESDRELAGPWRQLFRQVQSPRHVVSELLQNADDAGATEASVSVEDSVFVFRHDGEDFTDENFASLCRFGYSNKRALHTIGFRGIGFKSTFSLGDRVELRTPTLSVQFNKNRFTEPCWSEATVSGDGWTEIRVPITDPAHIVEIQKNMEEWVTNPISFLFFRHLRRFLVGHRSIEWITRGPGPADGTRWMVLRDQPGSDVLLAHSPAEPFPDDAVREIIAERDFELDEQMSFPSPSVDIVLGTPGKLYVVLPTGVDTDLPFACNAPFIQDPTRTGIKSVESSPTNRWLLERAGDFAATVMLNWLANGSNDEERAQAYALLPDVNREATTLPGTCAAIVEIAFDAKLDGEAFVLTDDGKFEGTAHCMSVPRELLEVWSATEVANFVGRRPSVLSRYVRDSDKRKLVNWRIIEDVGADLILDALENREVPKPQDWIRLLGLWNFLAPLVTAYPHRQRAASFRIIPAIGADSLVTAREAVRLGERRNLHRDDDWAFLEAHLRIMDPAWVSFLVDADEHVADADAYAKASAILEAAGLKDTTESNRMLARVASSFFAIEDASAEDCARLAQIAATLGAEVPASFQYVTADGTRRTATNAILVDPNGELARLLTDSWRTEHLLHPVYDHLSSCSAADWMKWSVSRRSRLRTFPPLVERETAFAPPRWLSYEGRKAKRSECHTNLESELRTRDFAGVIRSDSYVSADFSLADLDFDQDLWERWQGAAAEDPSVWTSVASFVFATAEEFAATPQKVAAYHFDTSGRSKVRIATNFTPRWAVRLRSVPCLVDDRGARRHPTDLFFLTPATQPLLDVEPFVDRGVDVEANRPLLKLLGVRDKPADAVSLLDRLRAIARSPVVRMSEVEKWYRRLDSLLAHASTVELDQVRQAFAAEKLILTDTEQWASSDAVYLGSDEDDVPGAEVVHRSLNDLAIWHRIDVASRPSVDRAIAWLKGLSGKTRLDPDELRRVRLLLSRHPDRIWDECRRWLTVDGDWVPAESLQYALTMRSRVPWKHLFPQIRRTVGDFQKLPTEVLQRTPFSELPTLGARITESETAGGELSRSRKEWMSTLGGMLARLQVDDVEECERLRELGRSLSRSECAIVRQIESTPMIDGVPAGTPRLLDALWQGEVLYVVASSAPRTARAVTHAIGQRFANEDITDAVKICYDREPHFIEEYVSENFALIPVEVHSSSQPTEKAAQVPNRPDLTRRSPVTEGARVDESEQDADELSPEESMARPRLKRSPLIERFARTRGFTLRADDGMTAPDGSLLTKDEDLPSAWNVTSTAGEIIHSYWAREQCLDDKPVVIPAEVWMAFERAPERWTAVLVDVDHAPIALPAASLVNWVRVGRAAVQAADYRISISSECIADLRVPVEQPAALETK